MRCPVRAKNGDVMDPTEPHRLHADDVVSELRTDPRQGLTDAEVRSRRERYGGNELATEQAIPAWRRFLAQFQDVLVVLLLIATGISAGLWAYERDAGLPYEALAIFAVVMLNATLGYVQQARAEAAVAALRAMSAADAAVIRNGERRSIPASWTCSAMARRWLACGAFIKRSVKRSGRSKWRGRSTHWIREASIAVPFRPAPLMHPRS